MAGFAGNYRLVRRVGQGGQGEVWVGEDCRSGARRCLKRIPGDSAAQAEKEAAMLARLAHPALPRIFGMFQAEGDVWLVQDYLEGETLKQYVQRSGCTEREIAGWGAELCEVLAWLHHQPEGPVLHLDIKPENLLRVEGGSLRLIDFGAAASPETALTGVAGTPGFIPQEQLEGRPEPGSDLFGLGRTLRVLAEAGGCLPGQTLAGILEQCMEADVSRRVASATALKQLFELCAGGVMQTGDCREIEFRGNLRAALSLAAGLIHEGVCLVLNPGDLQLARWMLPREGVPGLVLSHEKVAVRTGWRVVVEPPEVPWQAQSGVRVAGMTVIPQELALWQVSGKKLWGLPVLLCAPRGSGRGARRMAAYVLPDLADAQVQWLEETSGEQEALMRMDGSLWNRILKYEQKHVKKWTEKWRHTH